MSTIYTVNGKVLKNSATDKWLIKAVPPPPSFDSVTIGSQIWMSKNLAIDDGQGGIYSHTINYGQGNVTEYYYTWDAAVRLAASLEGWHLPSQSEWNTLFSSVGGKSTAGKKLKSNYGWNNNKNGTDNYGFSVFPSGICNNGSFIYPGDLSGIWTSNEYSAANAYFCMFSTNSNVDITYDRKTYASPVRLVKDA